MTNPNTAFIEYIYGQLKSINCSRNNEVGRFDAIKSLIDDIQAHLETEKRTKPSVMPEWLSNEELRPYGN